jgi:UDP-N-acetylmuramate dehydrogenase
VALAELTTMRVGGPAGEFVDTDSTSAAAAAVRESDAAGVPVLVIGGGSNLVVGDIGWDGRVVRIGGSAVSISGSLVRADAGAGWDALVALTITEGLAGLEALSGIPGRVGGTPIQNVGAFGALTSDVLESVSVLDRTSGQISEWPNARCRFGPHRQSAFKHTDRYVILEVSFRLRRSAQSAPITFARLAERLAIEDGGTAATADVRSAVLALRRERGSLLDPDDHDTWSAGSFFLNPVTPALPPSAADCPVYPDAAGVKLAAAWLIEHAGFPRGYGRDWGRGTVALSSKHTLVVTNRGGATASEVVRFAAHIRAGVQQVFGVRLVPECRLVNCSLDDADD